MTAYLRLESIEPTVFFVRVKEELRQIIKLKILNRGGVAEADLKVEFDSKTYQVRIGEVKPGLAEYEVEIPDVRRPTEVKFTLFSGGLQDEKILKWKPTRHWRIYIVQESHHDLGYTDLPQKALKEQMEFIDLAVRFCEETTDWPEDSKFRYSIEQSWSLINYIRHKPVRSVEKLLKFIREGRIEVSALYGNEISELCGHEELIRLLYPSFALKRKYGIPIEYAEITDVPGLSWALAMILSNCGVRYFSPGMPRGYFRHAHPFWDESKVVPKGMPRLFYWVGPDGSKILFWYGPGYGISETYFLSGYKSTCKILPEILAELEGNGYPYDAVRFRVQKAHRDNAPPSLVFSQVAREWNRRWAYPRMIIATNSMFFKYIEKKFGDELERFRGELPDTDYVVGASSTAYETGINRITHDMMLSAEKFSTIASIIADYEYPAETLREAYEHMLLYDEHTWGQANPIGPAQEANWAEKALHAYKASALAHDVLIKSLNVIVDKIRLEYDGYYIIVFNPLSWSRSDIVYAYLREPEPCGRPIHQLKEATEGISAEEPPILVSGSAIGRDAIRLPSSIINEPFELIDEETGRRVPYQIIEVSSPYDPIPYAAYRYAMGHLDRRYARAIVFLAENLPPMGYKAYRIMPCRRRPKFETSIRVSDRILENRFYRIEVDRKTGLVRSILDKELGRELLDRNAPHRFNQCIIRTCKGGEEHTIEEPNLSVGRSGPILGSIIIKGRGVGCPYIIQEITLYDQVKRVDVSNRLLKDPTPFLEVYFAFPFGIENPKIRFEASDSVIRPLRDQFPGSNTNYYAMQHWAHISDGHIGVAFSSIEAPLVEFGGLWPSYVSEAHHCITPSGYGRKFAELGGIRVGYIYSYVMNNNFRTNFQPVQVGDLLFRYSITSSSGDMGIREARKFGWEFHNPPIPVYMTGRRDGSLPAKMSFCNIDKPNAMLITMKRAEDGDGLILRLVETEGVSAKANIRLPMIKASKAYLTSPVEEDMEEATVKADQIKVPIRAFGISTVRVKMQGAFINKGLNLRAELKYDH